MLVIHLFSALYQGGAENQFEHIFADQENRSANHLVISLKAEQTELAKRLRDKGIEVVFFDFTGIRSFKELVRLKKFISQKCQTDEKVILHCWMYHANIIGWLVSLFTNISLIWSIRRTEIPTGMTGILARLAAPIGYLGNHKIVSNSAAGKISHERIFYPKRIKVIQNGIDSFPLSKSEPNTEESPNFKFIHIGRFAPVKGQLELLSAAVKFLESLPSSESKRVSFTFVGRNVEKALTPKLELTRFKNNFNFLGEVPSPRKLLGEYSCYVLSSQSEGFPNSLVEAMLESMPCIASDVGDVSFILSDNRYIYPHDDLNKLTSLLSEMHKAPIKRLAELGFKNRTRAAKCYCIDTVRAEYEKLYEEVAK